MENCTSKAPDLTDEICKRREGASPGPWYSGCGVESFTIYDRCGRVVCTLQSMRDAEFISHAREDVGWLSDERERLREGIHTLWGILVDYDGYDPENADHMKSLVDEATGAIASLLRGGVAFPFDRGNR